MVCVDEMQALWQFSEIELAAVNGLVIKGSSSVEQKRSGNYGFGERVG